MPTRVVAFACWAFLTWILLTWNRSISQLAFGAGLSLLVGLGCSFLGPALKPQRLASPRRALGVVALVLAAAWRVLRANLLLARRIWLPSRPLESGMVVVPTRCRSEGELAAVGLVTSLIVDNQMIDLDRERHILQYHSVSVSTTDPQENYESMNGPVERWLLQIAAAPKHRLAHIEELEEKEDRHGAPREDKGHK